MARTSDLESSEDEEDDAEEEDAMKTVATGEETQTSSVVDIKSMLKVSDCVYTSKVPVLHTVTYS